MRSIEDLPECDPKTIAPLNKRGVPDLYKYMPTRLIPFDEAKARKWTFFYDASICRYGHQAPRYTANARICVDCVRIREGKGTIGGKAGSMAIYAMRTKATKIPDVEEAANVHPDHVLEPDPKEKRFLEAYAKCRDIDEAAASVGLSGAQIEARIAWSAIFRDAINRVEDRLGIKRTVVPGKRYYWSDEKRERFIEVYVDTGDIATARDSIRVTPSEFFREIERNPSFDERVKAAAKLAEQALEERATQLALAGNDKLLQKLLAAKKPEYRERVNVEMNVTEKLDDRQLNARLARLINKFQPVLEGHFQVITEGQASPSGDAGRIGQERKPESSSDLLPLSSKQSGIPKTG